MRSKPMPKPVPGKPRTQAARSARSPMPRGFGYYPFPAAVAAQLDVRDPCCQFQGCAVTENLQRHHRRYKAAGGSANRPHTQCPCNGIRLCPEHHALVHSRSAGARDDGYSVSQSCDYPSSQPVLRTDGSRPARYWATCDGRWVTERPEGAAA